MALFDRCCSPRSSFSFQANYESDESSDGIFPDLEAVTISFGTFEETLSAGAFVCTGQECSYSAHNRGITTAVITDTSLMFRAEHIDLSDTKNPVDVAVRIGNDSGQTVVRLRGMIKKKTADP